MIQRIQSVFLAIAAMLCIGVFFTPIYDKTMADPQNWIEITLAAALTLSAIMSLASVFLYKNRMQQIKWVKYGALATIIALAICIGTMFSLGGIGRYLWDEALSTGLVVLILALQLLAIRFIKKDEELVRSMDRIR